MKLTRAAEYGIRCLLYLAGEAPGAVHNRRDIGQAMNIPQHFLSKVASDLAKAGLIMVVQGPRGGYRLARPAAEITLLDAIEAVEGEIQLNDCLLGPDLCDFQPGCPVHRVWGRVQKGMKDALASANFAELVHQGHKLSGLRCA